MVLESDEEIDQIDGIVKTRMAQLMLSRRSQLGSLTSLYKDQSLAAHEHSKSGQAQLRPMSVAVVLKY